MTKPLEKKNLHELAKGIHEQWSPLEVTRFNDSAVRLAKIQGEFQWHTHEQEDEVFMVLDGEITIQTDSGDNILTSNELVCIPHGTHHCPKAEKEALILLLEPAQTTRLGDQEK